MTDSAGVDAWLEELRRGWVGGDPEAIGALFAETVVYRASPFEKPLVGRDLVVAHWRDELIGVDDAVVNFSTPLVDGNRVAVEWWAVVTRGDSASTDSGALVLEFTGGLCTRLQEYWMSATALSLPPRVIAFGGGGRRDRWSSRCRGLIPIR